MSRTKIPKGWHVVNGKELERIENQMIEKGIFSKRKAPHGTIPEPKLWMQIVVKNQI